MKPKKKNRRKQTVAIVAAFCELAHAREKGDRHRECAATEELEKHGVAVRFAEGPQKLGANHE